MRNQKPLSVAVHPHPQLGSPRQEDAILCGPWLPVCKTPGDLQRAACWSDEAVAGPPGLRREVQESTVLCVPSHPAQPQNSRFLIQGINTDESSQENRPGTSVMGQWLRLFAPSAGGQGLIPDQRIGFHMLQLRPGTNKLNK